MIPLVIEYADNKTETQVSEQPLSNPHGGLPCNL